MTPERRRQEERRKVNLNHAPFDRLCQQFGECDIHRRSCADRRSTPKVAHEGRCDYNVFGWRCCLPKGHEEMHKNEVQASNCVSQSDPNCTPLPMGVPKMEQEIVQKIASNCGSSSTPSTPELPVGVQPAQHELKTWPEFFAAILDGSKTFELRWNDRKFKVGDSLKLREYEPSTSAYSGRELLRKVTYVLTSDDARSAGRVVARRPMVDGYCILGIEAPPAQLPTGVRAEDELRHLLIAADGYLSLLRHRAGITSWGEVGMCKQSDVDVMIGTLRRAYEPSAPPQIPEDTK